MPGSTVRGAGVAMAAGAGSSARGAAGSAADSTRVGPVDRRAEVSVGRRAGRSATGATCTPVGAAARWTSRTGPAASTGSSGAATGRTAEGSSSPVTGVAAAVSTFLTSPLGAASATAWDSVRAKDGSRHVLSRLPKPLSETAPPRAAPPVTRWTGGPVRQAGPRGAAAGLPPSTPASAAPSTADRAPPAKRGLPPAPGASSKTASSKVTAPPAGRCRRRFRSPRRPMRLIPGSRRP
ncbi:hypothetical protein [Streptomyces cellulosae]|uniref:hypothetical protein n=1 Tax=Streptomyces cellulosae TaxID=1968 RepID=UPI0004CB5E81|nr:hypothetical protein [Streptomyces cellulosae]